MARTGFAFTGAQTDADVVAATAGKAIRILRLMFTTSAAATISFTDGADAAGTRIIYGDFAANGGGVWEAQGNLPDLFPVATGTVGSALKVTSSAGNIKGSIEYVLV